MAKSRLEDHSFKILRLGVTLPETNSEFTSENGWLEDKPVLLKNPNFFGWENVSFRVGSFLLHWLLPLRYLGEGTSPRYTLPETNSLPLKIDPWKRRFLIIGNHHF